MSDLQFDTKTFDIIIRTKYFVFYAKIHRKTININLHSNGHDVNFFELSDSIDIHSIFNNHKKVKNE